MALTDNLVSYWKMDEGSSINRADSVASNTLVVNGTVGSVAGKISNAADFTNNVANFLSLASSSDFVWEGTVNRSFSLWAYFDTTAGVDTVFSRWANPAGTIQDWIIYRNGTSIVIGGRANGAVVTATSAVTTSTWYHIVVTMSSSNTMELFIDGVSKGSGTAGTSGGTTSDIYVGKNSNTNALDGRVDEVGWWTKVLSGAEITELYNAGAGLAYPFPGGATFRPRVTIY